MEIRSNNKHVKTITIDRLILLKNSQNNNDDDDDDRNNWNLRKVKIFENLFLKLDLVIIFFSMTQLNQKKNLPDIGKII